MSKKELRFGLEDSELRLLYEKAVKPLQHLQCAVYLFGSRARGDQKKFSDVDLMLAPGSPLPRQLIEEIRESLEESRFPFKVDLVLEDEIASSYRAQILRERIKL